MRPWYLLSLLTVLACEDPAESVARSFPSGPAPDGNWHPQGDGQSQAQGQGQPPEGVAPGGMGAPNTVASGVKPGEGVVIKGEVTYGGSVTGPILVEVLRDGEPYASVAYSFFLDRAGPFELETPKDIGQVFLAAYVDAKGDGPTAEDPAAVLTAAISVASTPVEGVSLKIVDGFDVGRFATWKDAKLPSPADGASVQPPPGGVPSVPVEGGVPEGAAPPAGEVPAGGAPAGDAPAGGAAPSGAPAAGAPPGGAPAAGGPQGGLYKPSGEPWSWEAEGSAPAAAAGGSK